MRAAAIAAVLALLALSCDGEPPPNDAGADGGDVGCSSPDDCDDGLFCTGVERCEVLAPGRSECVAGDPPCLAAQACDDAADSCVTACGDGADADGDGHDAPECGGDDCDDSDAARFPGNVEVCDAADVDEDCDATTIGGRDGDGDGAIDALCCNVSEAGTTCGTDCDDGAAGTHPTAPETCDDIDNDCDGLVDEGVLPMPCYPDPDMDGFAEVGAAPTDFCACPAMFTARAPIDAANADCGENDPEVHPGAVEVCDRIDSNCSTGGGVALDEDADDDGFTAIGFGGCAGGFPATDCEDTVADVNTAHTVYESAGYCAAPLELCDCAGGPVPHVCAATPGDCAAACAAGAPAARYDWNCSGQPELEPSATVTTCAPSGGLSCMVANPACGENGYTSAPTVADCGRQLSFIRCICSGVGTGNCVRRPPMQRPVSCR